MLEALRFSGRFNIMYATLSRTSKTSSFGLFSHFPIPISLDRSFAEGFRIGGQFILNMILPD